MKKPLAVYALCFLHIFLGIAAVGGGLLLIIRPDGSLLGMSADWLYDSPFKSYVLPGLILFTLNGIFPLFVFISLSVRPSWNWADALNIYLDRHWAWTYSLFVGIIVISWIIAQQLLTQYFWIQPVILLTGLMILVFTMLPQTIRYYQK